MIHRLIRNPNDPRSEGIWLTVYADMVTNLMLVFLALYGLTVMGKDAVNDAAQSMKMNPASTMPGFEKVVPALQETVGDADDVFVTQEIGAIRVQFGESVLFQSGHAELKPEAYGPLLKLGAILKIVPHTIVVEGHTDPIPLGEGSPFRDNYELSLARAMQVVDVLIKQGGIPSSQIAAAAYGEHRPRSSNGSRVGRRLNRRVEIAVFRDFPFPEKGPPS